MSWNHQPLGALLEQSGYDRAGARDYPVLSITMRQGLVDQSEKFKKRIASQNTANYRVVYKNELVVGFPIDEGVLGFQTKYPAGIVSPAYDIWKLKDRARTHIQYLERYLRSPQARRLYASKMQGAVARRRSLTKSDFLKLEIPFPSLDDQIRIAHLLSKVEGLIAQRKQHLQQLDALLKSVFLEMFGDPVRNEKGWEEKTIGDLIDEVKYGTSSPAKGGQYKYLRMNNITQGGYWDLTDLKYIDVDEKDFEKYCLRKGDLVFNRTNSKELVGKTAVYERDESVIIAGYLIRVRVNQHNNPWFIWGHLNSKYGKTRLFNLCRNIVGMANINAKELQAIPILKPPLPLQTKFATIVEKVEVIKVNYKKSLADLEKLYCALSQKSFKGELDLSRIVLPTKDTESTKEKEWTTSVANEAEPPPTIELPAPNDRTSLSSLEGRKGVIEQWLDSYLGQLGNSVFSSETFMKAAQQRLWELMEDGDPELPDLGVAEYDQLKTWVFEQVGSGKLKQTKNIISINGKRKFGNKVILRARQTRL